MADNNGTGINSAQAKGGVKQSKNSKNCGIGCLIIFIIIVIIGVFGQKEKSENEVQINNNEIVESSNGIEIGQRSEPQSPFDEVKGLIEDYDFGMGDPYSIEQEIRMIQDTELQGIVVKFFDESFWDEEYLVREGITAFVEIGLIVFLVEGIESITVVTETDFIDSFGNEEKEQALRITMDKNTFGMFNWENLEYRPVYNQISDNALDFYIHPGVFSKIKPDEIFYAP